MQRLALLLAVLHRHGGVETAAFDVFVNAVGGVRILEPAADLAVMLAVCSSLRNKPLPHKTLIFGEVGLAGEVRPVQRGQERIREAAKLGFETFIIPNLNKPKQAIENVNDHRCRSRRRGDRTGCASEPVAPAAATGAVNPAALRRASTPRPGTPMRIGSRTCRRYCSAIARYAASSARVVAARVEQRALRVPGRRDTRAGAPLVRVARERDDFRDVARHVVADELAAVRPRTAGSPRRAMRTSRRAASRSGQPAHSASLAVVCALYGHVSRNRSATRYSAR